jgi:ribosomal protein S18 acetylase RimI-like enzyme
VGRGWPTRADSRALTYTVRSVRGDDWQLLREIRLRALESDPTAFGGSYEESSRFPDSLWQERAAASESGVESRWFVAVGEDGSWHGMAQAHGGEDDAHLFGMWTDPGARGSGVSLALCDACADWARERGHTWIRLGAYLDNPRAISFYRKAGFEPFETLPASETEFRADLLLMRRAV